MQQLVVVKPYVELMTDYLQRNFPDEVDQSLELVGTASMMHP